MILSQPGGGWIELICGSMFSGKTEELLRRIRRAEIARRKVQIFKPLIDDRYGLKRVASHSGIAREDALVIHNAAEILQNVSESAEVIAIDEIQFFDWTIADVASTLANQGRRIIGAGLDQDFRGEPFGQMPELMAVAESVTKLQAVCSVCGSPSSRTQRLIDGHPASYHDPVILVGASEAYEPRCRHHHEVPKTAVYRTSIEQEATN